MKKKKLNFQFEKVESVHDLPGTLIDNDFVNLLKALDVEDIESYSGEELKEVTLMALQDSGESDAVSVILDTLFREQFTKGQLQNLTEELKEESAWDEYSDLADHRALYVCSRLMNLAFPDTYPMPSIQHLKIRISGDELDEFLIKNPLNKAMLLRGISRSEDDNCILRRLFSDQLDGGEFPEANWIIWDLIEQASDDNSRLIDCYGSMYWFKDLESGHEASVDISL